MLFNCISFPLEINAKQKKKPSLNKENLVQNFKLPIFYNEKKIDLKEEIIKSRYYWIKTFLPIGE
jgi:hypothetical protein